MKNIRYIGAGAGSGKTYRLTEELKDLFKAGVKPSEVILTTFSRAAAAEFKEKTREKLVKEGMFEASTELDSAVIGTVHAVAMKYIKKYWYKLGIPASVNEMDDDAKSEYVNKTLVACASIDDIIFFHKYAEQMNVTLPKSNRINYDFWKSQLIGVIEKADSFGIMDLTDSLSKSQDLATAALSNDGCAVITDDRTQDPYIRSLIAELINRIFKIADKWRSEFKSYKDANSLIEFNDMETDFIKLLEDKDVQSEISQSIKYVFVDEFQDSNPKQIQIFDMLSGIVPHSMWVGDPKQSIYRFRGCDSELVEAVINSEAVVKEKPLEYSRRSEKRLVETANAVFEPVFDYLAEDERTLKPFRGEDLPVNSLWNWDLIGEINPETKRMKADSGMLNNALSAQIKDILDGKNEIKCVIDKDTSKPRPVKASDIAILTRTNDQALAIVSELSAFGIPVITEYGASMDNCEIREVALLLNLMISDSSLLDVELCKLHLGKNIEEIFEMSEADMKDRLQNLYDLKKELSSQSVSGLVRNLIIRLDLLDKCGQWGYADSRRTNLIAMMKAAEAYDSNCISQGQNATVEGFLESIKDGVPVEKGYCDGGVTVTTYHSSKGLEWNIVILYSLWYDEINLSKKLSDYVMGINVARMTKATPGKIYSDYYLTFVPKYTRSYLKGTAANAIQATPEFQDYYEKEVREAQRILYVGFTRARDYLITVSTSEGQSRKFKWFECLVPAGTSLSDIKDNWDVVKKDWPDCSLQHVWGPKSHPSKHVKIGQRVHPDPDEPTKYNYPTPAKPDEEIKPQHISPSSLTDDALVSRAKVTCIDGINDEFNDIIKTKDHTGKENIIGTCIHNIFAAYDPSADPIKMAEIAENTVSAFNLTQIIPDPSEIISSIKILYSFLEQKYWKTTEIDHETPYVRVKDCQTITGSIDLLWYSPDRSKAVLIDFKNLIAAKQNILNDRADKRALIHYAPQQKAYRDALEANHIEVVDCLLYLSMQGRIVKLEF